MTLYQYNLLDSTDRTCVLWNKGVFLSERKTDQHAIALYQIDAFYVEVFYHPEHNSIERLRSFRSVDQLRPYLEQDSLRDLL